MTALEGAGDDEERCGDPDLWADDEDWAGLEMYGDMLCAGLDRTELDEAVNGVIASNRCASTTMWRHDLLCDLAPAHEREREPQAHSQPATFLPGQLGHADKAGQPCAGARRSAWEKLAGFRAQVATQMLTSMLKKCAREAVRIENQEGLCTSLREGEDAEAMHPCAKPSANGEMPVDTRGGGTCTAGRKRLLARSSEDGIEGNLKRFRQLPSF
jgi:hypothetical protein